MTAINIFFVEKRLNNNVPREETFLCGIVLKHMIHGLGFSTFWLKPGQDLDVQSFEQKISPSFDRISNFGHTSF